MEKKDRRLEDEALAGFMRELEERIAKKDRAAEDAWAREMFQFETLPRQANIDVVRRLLAAEGIRARRNMISGDMEFEGLPPSLSHEQAPATLPVLLKDILKNRGCGVTTEHMREFLLLIADENRYNPIEDMLTGTVWDGEDRVGELDCILGIQDEPHPRMSQTYLRKWLIQSVALALNDERNPVGAEGLLVLQGPQGAGKTRVFRVLAIRADWFCEGATINMDDKDSLIRATSSWITELGELDSTVKREQSALKAFITQAMDRYRPPYGRAMLRRPRRTSLAATVNPDEFLRDETGNRRYWVVPVKEIDLEALGEVTEDWTRQLWAQVYTWYKQDPQGFRLTAQEQKYLAERNRAFDMPMHLETEIRDLLDFDMSGIDWRYFRASDIKQRIGMYNASAEQIGKVLRKLAREDKRVDMRKHHGTIKYKLPVR